MKVHEILRVIRRKRELTLENLAAELDISYSTYQSYEQEGSKIQIETLERIAKHYGLTLLELLSYNDERDSDSIILEPHLPFKIKSNSLKILVELDGSKDILTFWQQRLENLNSVL